MKICIYMPYPLSTQKYTKLILAESIYLWKIAIKTCKCIKFTTLIYLTKDVLQVSVFLIL
jgi:hypothetical protein